MSMWPSSLIQHPLRASFGESPGDSLLRTETEQGPGKRRRAYTAVDDPVTCTVVLRSQEEKDLLRSWFTSALAGGALGFQWPQLGSALGESNLLDKGDFADLQIGLWGGVNASVQSTAEPWGGYLQIMQRDNLEAHLSPVVPNQRLHVRARLRSIGCIYPVVFGIGFTLQNGAIFFFNLDTRIPPNTNWTLVHRTVVAPAGSVFVRGYPLIEGPANMDIGPAGFAELFVSTAPLGAIYQFASPPQFAKRGARGWTAELSLVRKP